MEACVAANYAAAINGSPANIFASLIQTLLAAQCGVSNPDMHPPDRSEEILSDPDREFDFVIAGGGSAGSVVAGRLSEIENWKVLLIEAGENPTDLSEIPGGFLLQLMSPAIHSHFVQPEKLACHGSKNKLCRWPTGEVLGGGSTVNAMLYIYGNEEDYNEWSRMGNKGWSWEEVLPYFKKSNNFGHGLCDKSASKYCGHDGPLNVRSFNYTYKNVFDPFLDAARELNVPILDVINSDKYIGYGWAYGTVDGGRRMSAAKAYLSPNKNRRNLYVMRSARADTVLLDGNRAVGVRVTLKDGSTIDVKASKEVILSAGSVGTSRILLLSGIGPEQHLRQIGIPSAVNLPVGKNLQDHVAWYGLYMSYKNQSMTPPSPTFLLDQSYQYLMHKQGMFATSAGHDFHGFINVNDSNSKYPNIQFHHTYLRQWDVNFMKIMLGGFYIDDEIIKEITNIVVKADVIMTYPVLLKPKSVGEIQLRSKDPADPLKIFANYYSEQEDFDTMLNSLYFLKKMLNTKAIKQHGMKLHSIDLPGCRHTQPDSDEYWKCNMRHMSLTIFHPSGTAKMGPRDDPTAVVDSRLKVHGMQGLRVIDASIMPRIISGNTNAPAIMIGEKGADFIKDDWAKAEGKDEL